MKCARRIGGGHEQQFDQHGQVGNVLELASVV